MPAVTIPPQLVVLAELLDAHTGRYQELNGGRTVQEYLALPRTREDEELLTEPLMQRYSPFPGPFSRGVVACTGSEFCRFAIVETKARAVEWATEMDERFAAGPGEAPPGQG